MELYYYFGSPCSIAVLMVLKELGLQVELKPTDMYAAAHQTPEYVKLNPNRSVPTLIDRGLILYDSHAITTYLVDKYGSDRSLYPKDIALRSKVNNCLFFDTGSMYPALLAVVTPPIHYGSEIKPETMKEFSLKATALDQMLANRKYLVGDKKTLADLHLYASLSLTSFFDYDMSVHTNIVRWRSNLDTELPYKDEIISKPMDKLLRIVTDLMAKRRSENNM
ncbi:Glutathione S-transferase 1, isoform C [Halotydeus destructor]|nr:Glutathione S-transferase 1, isoform C [Halotydeus destructor]